MHRFTLAAIAVSIAAVAASVTWVATKFTVRIGTGSVMLLTREQAAECDEGAGCEALSARQVSMMVMSIVKGLAAGHPPPRTAPDPKRSDI